MTLSIRHEQGIESPRTLGWGPFAVLTGALLMLAGLWAPWYRINLPDGFFGGLAGMVAPADGSGGMFQAFAAGIDDLERQGRLQTDAWGVLTYVDIGIAACAAVAVAALVLTFMEHLDRFPTDLVSVTALAAGGLVVLRVANPPGPTGILEILWGPWMCLAGAALVLVGSRMAFRP